MKVCLVVHKYGVPLDDPCCYPLGFMYVSARLKELEHQVKVLNYNLFDYNFVEEVKDQDIVGFTGFEEFATRIVRDANICKQLGVKTILGGALATFVPQVIGKYVDQICVGEFETPSKIDELALPDYEGFGIEEYNRRHSVRYMGVLASRGCPFSCTFCSQTCEFRVREIGKVFEEIDLYKSKYEVERIIFNDNTFNVSKQRFMTFCNGMLQRGLTWSAAIRCDTFDEDMARAAKESGCVYFVVGVESFSQDRLNKMNKSLKVEEIRNTLDLLHKYDLKYHGNILLGFEDESYADVAKEVASIPSQYNIFPTLVQPFVGTVAGKTRLLSEEQIAFLADSFKEYVYSQDMYQYPVTGKGGTA